MSKLSDSDVQTESGSDDDSDWLIEEGPSKLRDQKKMRRRSGKCRNGSINRPASHQRRCTSISSFLPQLGESLKQKTRLPVTCGNKEGILHKHKFNKGESCILSGDQWFTPGQFEKFGGKMKNKNWKKSIFCKQIMLKELIQVGILSSPLFKARPSQDKESECKEKLIKSRKRIRHSFVPKSHISGTISSSNLSVGSDYSDVDYDDNDSDDADSNVQVTKSEFTGDSFKVKCSRGKGVLHINRFATDTCGKCIRTQDAWLTPKEFLYKNNPAGNWKQDISSRGVTLGMLIMRRVLTPHSVNCNCSICTGSPLYLLDQNNDDVCFKCSNDGDLVCCNECPRAFHHHCHNPALADETISEHWTCSFCKKTSHS